MYLGVEHSTTSRYYGTSGHVEKSAVSGPINCTTFMKHNMFHHLQQGGTLGRVPIERILGENPNLLMAMIKSKKNSVSLSKKFSAMFVR